VVHIYLVIIINFVTTLHFCEIAKMIVKAVVRLNMSFWICFQTPSAG